MSRLLTLSALLLTSTLLADNRLQIIGTVKATANTEMKTVYVTDTQIKQDILVQTNSKNGVTISLAKVNKNSSITSSGILLNNQSIQKVQEPLDIASEVYLKPTKVGELKITKYNHKDTILVVVAVK